MESLQNEIYLFKKLNNAYSAKFGVFSYIESPIKTMLTFSKNGEVKLPLKIKGRLITAGKYKDKELGEFYLPANELKKSLDNWKGKKIYSSHKIFQEIMSGQDPNIREVLGQFTNLEWNELEEGIDFSAEVYDEDVARKINAGLIDKISAGFGREVFTEMSENAKLEYYVRNIEPGEASFVFNPRDPNAHFEPIEV